MNPPSPLPAASADHVLSLTAHRDLSRRRHEEHDLSWCREQLSLLSSNLKSRLAACTVREENLRNAEITAADRIERECVQLVANSNIKIKTEYEARLTKFEGVVKNYHEHGEASERAKGRRDRVCVGVGHGCSELV